MDLPTTDQEELLESADTTPTRGAKLRRRARQLTGAVFLAVGYWTLVKPWMMNWGATRTERTTPLPGDDLLAEPDGESTMAVTVDAPPEDIWPWLRQLGQEQGGFYSYEWAENLVGLGVRNADEIILEYQNLSVGDTVRLGRADRFPDLKLEVAAFTPEESLVLQSPDRPPWWIWSFNLIPVAETETRLVVRSRIRLPENPAMQFASQLLLDPVTFVMTRGMLLGVKTRAERSTAREIPIDDHDAEPVTG